jgi:hypothetical protein
VGEFGRVAGFGVGEGLVLCGDDLGVGVVAPGDGGAQLRGELADVAFGDVPLGLQLLGAGAGVGGGLLEAGFRAALPPAGLLAGSLRRGGFSDGLGVLAAQFGVAGERGLQVAAAADVVPQPGQVLPQLALPWAGPVTMGGTQGLQPPLRVGNARAVDGQLAGGGTDRLLERSVGQDTVRAVPLVEVCGGRGRRTVDDRALQLVDVAGAGGDAQRLGGEAGVAELGQPHSGVGVGGGVQVVADGAVEVVVGDVEVAFGRPAPGPPTSSRPRRRRGTVSRRARPGRVRGAGGWCGRCASRPASTPAASRCRRT